MRRFGVLAAVVVAAVFGLGSVTLALGEKPSPWSPFEAPSFEAPAGTRCQFDLGGEVLSDHERIRTLETYADGSPRVQQVVGQLIVRYTNLDTGESVTRNLTGNGIIEYLPDGSFTLTLQGGHFAAGLAPTDAGGPAFLVFTGSGHSLRIEPDGTRTVTYGSGPVEDICQTLA